LKHQTGFDTATASLRRPLWGLAIPFPCSTTPSGSTPKVTTVFQQPGVVRKYSMRCFPNIRFGGIERQHKDRRSSWGPQGLLGVFRVASTWRAMAPAAEAAVAPMCLAAVRGVPVSSLEVVAALVAPRKVAESLAPHRGSDFPWRTCTAGTPCRSGAARSIAPSDRHWRPPPSRRGGRSRPRWPRPRPRCRSRGERDRRAHVDRDAARWSTLEWKPCEQSIY
jgi:hypothetical protein